MPVKRVEIPELTGSMFPLGIPTVLERLIQQAMTQVPGSDGGAGRAIIKITNQGLTPETYLIQQAMTQVPDSDGEAVWGQ